MVDPSDTNSALLTWSLCDLPSDVGHDSMCCTMVFSSVPSGEIDDLLSSESELPLSAAPTPSLSEAPDPPIYNAQENIERGNVHTFLNPDYSSKDHAKLNANLKHCRMIQR